MLEYVNINNDPKNLVKDNNVYAYEAKQGKVGTILKTSPADVIEREYQATKNSKIFVDEIYNQIWVFNKKYDVGFISQDVLENVEVWNAYRTSQTLESITYTAGEIEITPDSTPVEYEANQSKFYQLKIAGTGASSINASFVFKFIGQDAIIGNVTGERAIIFDFNHNWIQNYAESFKFYTEILTTLTLNEQRFSYASIPEYKCTYYYSLKKDDKQKLDNLIYNVVNQVVTVPLYVYAVQSKTAMLSGDTTFEVSAIEHTIIQNDLSLMFKYKDKKEIVDVLSFDKVNKTVVIKKPIVNDFPVGSILIPLISARIDEVTKDNVVTEYSNYTITFEKIKDDDIDLLTTNYDSQFDDIGGVTYVGNTFKPNDDLNVSYDYTNSRVLLTNEYGLKEYYSYSDINAISFEFEQVIIKNEMRSNYKNLWTRQGGMWQDLYIDNFSNDLTVVRDIEAHENVILIKDVNATNYVDGKNIEYLSINCFNKKYRVKVMQIYKYADGIEAIAIDNNLGERVSVNSINNLSFIFFGRLNSDELVLNYSTDGVINTTFSFYKTIDEADE